MCCFFNVWLLNVFMLLTLFQLLSHFGNNNSFILISKNMYFVYNDTPTHLCQLDAQCSNFFVIFISHKNLATVFLFLQCFRYYYFIDVLFIYYRCIMHYLCLLDFWYNEISFHFHYYWTSKMALPSLISCFGRINLTREMIK